MRITLVKHGPRFCLCAILMVSLGLSAASCAHQPETNVFQTKLPFGGVNAPLSQQKITGKMDFTGWVISEEGIESVSIYVDRAFVSNCSTGLARPDVAKAYPNMPGSGASGWAVTFDPANFSPGWHELTVQAKSKAGATRDVASSLPFMVQR
jgi:hypothetical protein